MRRKVVGPRRHRATNKSSPMNRPSSLAAFVKREKELTHLSDEIARERRALPWVKVEKPYVFEGQKGRQTLVDLFDGRSQLIVYHFMFGPDWEEGCPSCSYLADHIDGTLAHLAHRDVTLLAVSRARFPQIEGKKKTPALKPGSVQILNLVCRD